MTFDLLLVKQAAVEDAIIIVANGYVLELSLNLRKKEKKNSIEKCVPGREDLGILFRELTNRLSKALLS